MSFRRRLLLLMTLVVVVTVGGVATTVWVVVRRSFDRADRERTAALVAQFRREFERRGEEVARRVDGIAQSEALNRIAVELARTPDYAPYVNEAQALAAAHQLDFLELVAWDGTTISSAQWPARFGYKETGGASAGRDPFLQREELPEGTALGLFAVRAVEVGERPLYVIGGLRLDARFVETLVLPAGMRAQLYDLGAGKPESALVERVAQERREATAVAENETVHAIPLLGTRGEVLGVLTIASSRRSYVELVRRIGTVALLVGGAGILLAIVFSGWMAARVTRPVEEIVCGARAVTAGDWEARVTVMSEDEIGELAANFNRMTRELGSQRERALQAERVAAWRELARRLAHELKNPLFPLQLTVENLARARERSPEEFDEVFRESTATLLAELQNLKQIVGRFSDFSKMPQPRLEPVDLNELARGVLKTLEAQARERRVEARVEANESLARVAADPELLHRALSNLALNALDAMPQGGVLTLRTRSGDGRAVIEVSDTGTGLTKEECERLFTPYYTTKQHGTGLGLAIAQSVVSDHGGTIAVESAPGKGTTFRIELPMSTGLRVPSTEKASGA